MFETLFKYCKIGQKSIKWILVVIEKYGKYIGWLFFIVW